MCSDRAIGLIVALLAGTLLAATEPVDAALDALRGGDEARCDSLPPAGMAAVLDAIGAERLERGRPLVLAHLADKDEVVRAAALATFMRLGGDADGVADVRAAVQEGPSKCRVLAMLALGSQGDQASIPLIAPWLTGDDTAARGAARIALKNLVHRDLGETPQPWLDWFAAKDHEANDLLPRLATQLQGTNPAEVKLAIERLALCGDHRNEAVEMLLPLMGHGDPAVAAMAADAVRRLGGPVAIKSGVYDAKRDVGAEAPALATARAAAPPLALAAAMSRPLSGSMPTLVAAAVLVGLVGALLLMLFLTRSGEAGDAPMTTPISQRMTQRQTQRVTAPITRVGTGLLAKPRTVAIAKPGTAPVVRAEGTVQVTKDEFGPETQTVRRTVGGKTQKITFSR